VGARDAHMKIGEAVLDEVLGVEMHDSFGDGRN
jgi:hypothetical protein